MRPLTTSLWIALGSGLGGVLHHRCAGLVTRWFGETFPWGHPHRERLRLACDRPLRDADRAGRPPFGRPTARQFVMIGMLGGYTTFSSFSLKTLALAQSGEWLRAAANVVGSVLLCLTGVWLGHALALALAINR
jgi:CrcB protein